MVTTDLLSELFCSRVEELGDEKGLTAHEKERIIKVFQQALANPFMDEQQIYAKLTGEARL
ncbi:hypothetical protein DENIS_0741 [Desulfonema ishimotonii]|uniref:Uncharacterized protein n=1 Tax=Desulfonema ishimotonii TaxID=45657 RepID=A0A401FS80_9BACT|nr:hypothetical protein [Desulfonema ishimotonii]GBC59800.1 hypothetical protein DENIS_0741 [Desulfonema ishimotonii]